MLPPHFPSGFQKLEQQLRVSSRKVCNENCVKVVQTIWSGKFGLEMAKIQLVPKKDTDELKLPLTFLKSMKMQYFIIYIYIYYTKKGGIN